MDISDSHVWCWLLSNCLTEKDGTEKVVRFISTFDVQKLFVNWTAGLCSAPRLGVHY